MIFVRYWMGTMKDTITISGLVERAHSQSVAAGWYLSARKDQLATLARLALIHSEVSEATECVRESADPAKWIEWADIKGKPEGLVVELADAVIRIADLAGWLGLDLEGAIARKLDYNLTRPYRHGKEGL